MLTNPNSLNVRSGRALIEIHTLRSVFGLAKGNSPSSIKTNAIAASRSSNIL